MKSSVFTVLRRPPQRCSFSCLLRWVPVFLDAAVQESPQTNLTIKKDDLSVVSCCMCFIRNEIVVNVFKSHLFLSTENISTEITT